MNYCSDLGKREGEAEEVVEWIKTPDLEYAQNFRDRVSSLGLVGKTSEELKKSANNELDLLKQCRLNIMALGVSAQLDESPERGGGKVALGHVFHGENKMHLASYDHMKSVAEASSADIDVVDVLNITAEHEKLHIGLHSSRQAVYQVITSITGKAEDGHNAEEGAVSIKSKSRLFDDYRDEADFVGEIAGKIKVSEIELVDWVVGGEAEKIQEAAEKKGLIEFPKANKNSSSFLHEGKVIDNAEFIDSPIAANDSAYSQKKAS